MISCFVLIWSNLFSFVPIKNFYSFASSVTKSTKASKAVNEETILLKLMNKQRTKQGLQKLTMNAEAANIASNLASVISSGFFSGSMVDSYLESMNTQGGRLTQTHGTGKNAKVVFKMQFKVASEKAKILNGANTQVGISVTDAGNKQKLFVMVFVQSSTGEKPPTTENPPGGSQASAMENRVLELVNQERSRAGLRSLQFDAEVHKVAKIKAEDMYKNRYFSHTSPTYGSPGDMLQRFGVRFSYWGENIAMGQSTPETVMNTWMNSDGHRSNILNANFTHLGVGTERSYQGSGYIWVQMFIRK